jgi:hypothetical protein
MASEEGSLDARAASRPSIRVDANGKSSVHFKLNFFAGGFIVY